MEFLILWKSRDRFGGAAASEFIENISVVACFKLFAIEIGISQITLLLRFR